MNWGTAVAWANGLTIGSYTDWRLPTALNRDGSGPDAGNVTGSEMGHLFYEEWGGTAFNPISGSVDPDLALFPGLQDYYYWSGTEYSPNTSGAWIFGFIDGRRYTDLKTKDFYGLAVRSGDVAATAAVPEPATIALLGIGLAGLAGGAARRRLRKNKP